MVSYISRECPFSFDFGVSFRFAAKAAPAAFCWAFDLAGMCLSFLQYLQSTELLSPVLTAHFHHPPQ